MGGGFLRYGVWGVHIWVKEGPKGVFDPGKTKTDVTIILFSWSIIEIWQKLAFFTFLELFQAK